MQPERATAEGPLNADLYERVYGVDGAEGQQADGWRALSAVGKADHVAELLGSLDPPPRSLLDVGCGAGFLLSELGRRGIAERRDGLEISRSAVSAASGMPGISSVALFDGTRIDAADRSYDLGVLSHVLEHVENPAALLAETARVCSAVVVEVPLELNLSAGRAAKRAIADSVGHVHSFDRAAARDLATSGGLTVVAELSDPLPIAAHTYFAQGRSAYARALAKALVRRATFTVSRRLAERAFTVHYAYLCRAAP
jgi:SAM-dependent methyltransferase